MKKYLYTLIVLCFLGNTSCRKVDMPQKTVDASNQQVVLTLNLPVQELQQPKTYAISVNDENRITAVDVLAFRVVNGQELFAYRKQGRLLATGGSSNQAKFYADLVKDEDPYRFVVLCNVSAELNSATSLLQVNRLKSDILNTLVKVQTTKWNAASSQNFTPFPMWAESAVIDGIRANSAGLSFNLIRSVAAIDVSLSNAAANDFLITSVNLYGSNRIGLIAPLNTNFNNTTNTVIQPSIASLDRLPVQTYTLNVPFTRFENEIYLFETQAATAMNDINSTGLVIGGRYKGSSVNSYYRIEMVNSSGTLIPLLRNHRYTVNITSISGGGFSDVETAWRSVAENITAAITPWNEANLGEVSIPDAYELAVSTSAIRDDGGSKEVGITVRTNYAGGWAVRSSSEWITPANTNGQSGNRSLAFTIDRNSTNAVRTGVITITSGRLVKNIAVTQLVPDFNEVPGLDFYIAKHNLPGNPTWYLAGNVEENLVTDKPASQSPASPVRVGSCAQVYGDGWRLPTREELTQLIPTAYRDRITFNNLLWANSIDRFMLDSFYWADESSYRIPTIAAYIRGGRSTNGIAVTIYDRKSTTKKYFARCVKTRP